MNWLEVPALCLPEVLWTSSAVTRKFSAREMELVSDLHVSRETRIGSEKLERLSFLFLYTYLMHFMLSYLELNPGVYRKELAQHDFTARASAACLILCNILWIAGKLIDGVVRLTIWLLLEECTSLFVGPDFWLIKTLLVSWTLNLFISGIALS